MSVRQVGSFLILEEIARGHLGVIHRAEQVLTHEPVAVKIVSLTALSPLQHKELETEMRYLMSISSSRVVRLKEYLRTETFMYLFMEYCVGGSLLGYVMSKGPAPEGLGRKWLRDIAEGLSDMKRANAMHRDVKLSHVLLTSTDESARAKLSGTGFSRFALDNTATRSVLGTPLFMAPEILRKEAYGYKVDVWSLGVTAYYLLLGVEPYQVTTLEQLQAAQRVPIAFNKYCTLSGQAQSFILALMQYQPDHRPSYDQILAHPFLQEPSPAILVPIQPNVGKAPATTTEESKAVGGVREPIQTSAVPEPANFPMQTISKETPKPAVLPKVEETPKPEAHEPVPALTPPSPQPVPKEVSKPVSPAPSNPPAKPIPVPLHPEEQKVKSTPPVPLAPASPFTHFQEPPQLVISRIEATSPSPFNDPMGFSLIEISPLEDEYSIVDVSQVENMQLEGEDCKKLLPLASRFRSVFNIPMARSICVACKQVYEREMEKGRKLLRGVSMQESYIGPLLQAINTRLEAVNKEFAQLGTGDLARVQDYETEIDNRLAVAPGHVQEEVIYEEIRLLSKAGAFHFPNHTTTFAESYSAGLRALGAKSP